MKRQLADPKRSVRAAPLSRTISANPRAATNSRSVPSYTSSLVPFQAPLIPVCLTSTGTRFAGHSTMPDVIREDMAFLDRIHFYIPGWEMPKMKVDFFTNHYGFVVDYLAEALRELRKHTFTEVLDRHFSLGSHLKSRDVKAVRKTVSGLVKLIYPNGEVSKDEVAELVELSLEGRRRVKEQLKKMGSFEFHQTSFSLIDNETREEKFDETRRNPSS